MLRLSLSLCALRVARRQSARNPGAFIARASVRSATSASVVADAPIVSRYPLGGPVLDLKTSIGAPLFYLFSEPVHGGDVPHFDAPVYSFKSKGPSPAEPAEKPLKQPALGEKPAEDGETDAPKKSDIEVPENELNVPENEAPGSTNTPAVAGTSGSAATGGSGSNGGNNNGNNDGNNDGNDDGNGPLAAESVSETGAYPPFLAIAMKDRPQLPGREFLINISDPKVQRTVKEICSRREPHFVLFHMTDPDMPDTDIIPTRGSVHDIGAHCFVLRTYEDGDNLRILGRVMERCRLEQLVTPEEAAPEAIDEDSPTLYLRDFGVSYARVTRCDDEPYNIDSPEMRFLIAQVKAYFEVIDTKIPSKKIVATRGASLLNSPLQLADFIGSLSAAPASQIQALLSELNVEERLRKALELFKVELKLYHTLIDTTMELTLKAEEAQHKQFIREYIKGLQKHIGGPDASALKTAKFDERIRHMHLSEEAMEAYQAEKAKLEAGQEHSSELAVSEKYLDWLTSIPWGIYSKDRFNVRLAQTVLDRDHYGLKDVKDRILEFISMGKISGKVDGKILCLVGPPGTGKTSIAKSIAESLDRRYVRIAMGGIQDVHEVKGHRRTYVGSIPGRIISALKQAKTLNPLLLIDEIDKLDMSKSGGAASAFLEILDPEQNNAFVDNYIDVKVDLSKVLFVCTANYLGNIPGPLRDRMEVIEVPGYTNNEKFEIVMKHLIPNAAKKANLDESRVSIDADSARKLIEKYCRESGLRNLKKLITRIFSKASLKIVRELEMREPIEPAETGKKAAPKINEDDSKIVQEFKTIDTTIEKSEDSSVLPHEIPKDIKLDVTPEVLKDYVGPEIYTKTRVYDIPPPGVATGLAYSTSGNGDALYIESILTNSIGAGTGSAGVRVTGHLKDVMKESASIAYSFSKLFMVKNYPENRFFEGADIHVHCPEGAIPKDGPSAGIAFTSSLISLALNQSLPPSIAMTGEITLTGKVSAVGGLREKILGAKRYGCDTIIFPRDIENELEEISEEVKAGMTFIPVLWYDEVFAAIFPNADKDKINRLWKKEFAKLDEKKKGKK